MELVKMFEDYAKEKGFGAQIHYVPNVGFATYYLNGEECYVEELYVLPEKRRSKEGNKIGEDIIIIAKENGAKFFTGSVNLKANGKASSMKALLSFDMSPVATNGDMVYFSKEI